MNKREEEKLRKATGKTEKRTGKNRSNECL